MGLFLFGTAQFFVKKSILQSNEHPYLFYDVEHYVHRHDVMLASAIK